MSCLPLEVFVTFGGQSIFPLLCGEKQGNEDGRCQYPCCNMSWTYFSYLTTIHVACIGKFQKVFNEDKDVVRSPTYNSHIHFSMPCNHDRVNELHDSHATAMGGLPL